MKRQVVLVGAGPGGSTAAFYLAQAGVDVLLIDKEIWPRDKTCGDSYLPSLFPIFEDMGIMEEMRDAVACEPNALRIVDPDEEISEFKLQPWFIIPRRIGDDIIRQGAVRGGAEFMENFDAIELIIKRGVVKGIKGYYNNQETTVEADVVVIANGSHSMLARQLGVFKQDPELELYCFRQYFKGVEGMQIGMVEEFYTPKSLPHPTYSPICMAWVCPLYDGSIASVGMTIGEKYLRETKMSLEELFDWWCKNTKYGQARMKNAKPIDKRKGWRLPGSKTLEKSYAAGAIIIGDAANAAECAFEYGIPSAMLGGKIGAAVIAEALKKGDVSEAALSVYQKEAEKELNPGLNFNAMFREVLLSKEDEMKRFAEYAKKLPDYPNIYYDQTVVQYIQGVLNINIATSEKKISQ